MLREGSECTDDEMFEKLRCGLSRMDKVRIEEVHRRAEIENELRVKRIREY